jgi:sulfoxide reductase heme-binding subunit YedZ
MEARRKKSPLPWLKPAVLTGSLVPIAAILERAWRDDLGPDPIAQALNQLGLIALVFLVAALGCTPLKTIFGWTWPMRIRRMLGLLAFFYAFLHVITYTVLDQGLDWNAIVDDVVKRKFIFLGFSTFLLLIPLAAHRQIPPSDASVTSGGSSSIASPMWHQRLRSFISL